MVCTFSPPGVSSARANSRRASARRRASGAMLDRSRMASSSAASSSVVQCGSVSNTRFAMLAAAALVKVMQRIFSGSTPASSRLITRCASTWVLPEPALAETQAETSGSDDLALQPPHGGRDVGRRSHVARLPPPSSRAAGARPFLDAREMVVVAVMGRPHRMHERAIGLALVLEAPGQRGELFAARDRPGCPACPP